MRIGYMQCRSCPACLPNASKIRAACRHTNVQKEHGSLVDTESSPVHQGSIDTRNCGHPEPTGRKALCVQEGCTLTEQQADSSSGYYIIEKAAAQVAAVKEIMASGKARQER